MFREFWKNRLADVEAAKTIIMFLVVVLVFTGVFGTIALKLELLGENADVASIPGGTVMISIVGILGIILIVMWAIKKAFIVDWNGHTMRNLRRNRKGESSAAEMIILFLVVVLIFAGVFGTIAMKLNDLGSNGNVAKIPGGTVMISIVGILGIIIIVMWAVKRAFVLDWTGQTMLPRNKK